MSFEITRGLAAFDCPDHYATLGISIDATSNEIRKRYLKIARSLHPDSCGPSVDKGKASLVLSKLVNPAYEALSKDKERDEYQILLRLISQRANLEKERTALAEQSAQDLLQASDFETFYQDQVKQLAQAQYQSLDQVQDVVTRLSELNLAYLLRRETQRAESAQVTYARASAVETDQTITAASPSASLASKPSSTDAAASGPSGRSTSPGGSARSTSPGSTSPGPSARTTDLGQSSPTTPASPPASKSSAPSQSRSTDLGSQDNQYVSQYCRRAEELIAKNRFQAAIQELRDALKLNPKSSRCHSLLGTIYLKQQQTTMARVHLTQALKFNSQEQDALKGMEQLKKIDKKQQPATKGGTKSSERKGLFGLFGGK